MCKMLKWMWRTRTQTKTLGAAALCWLVLVASVLSVTGCSGVQVAQSIVNFSPALQSAADTVDTTASLLLPADALIFTAATAGIDAAVAELDAQAKVYLANPVPGVLSRLQAAAVTAQQTVNKAMLDAVGITDSAGQQHALAAIGAVATIVTAIFGLVQSISSKTALAQMAVDSPIKLAAVRPYLSVRQMQPYADGAGVTVDQFFRDQAERGF